MDNSINITCEECTNYTALTDKILFFQMITKDIMEMKPLDELLDEIVDSSKKLIEAEASSLLLYDEETENLFFHIAKGDKSTAIESSYIKLGQGIAGWVAEKQESLKIDDCYADKRFNPDFDKRTGFKTRNMLCVPMIHKDELIGALQVINKTDGKDFSEQDLSFFQSLASQCAIAIENARLVDIEIKSQQLKFELETARNIQQKLLPGKLPAIPNLDISVTLIPAKEVGGDYYNVININEKESLIFIADVTGKSVSAALIVSTIYSFIQTYMLIHETSFNLTEFIETLNKFLLNATTSDKFVSAWFALYNNDTNELEYISAGHNPTYMIKNGNGSINELNAGGLFLGSIDMPYTSEKILLEEEDTIVFYTDGITEAMDINGEEFGEDTFKKLISKRRTESSSKLLNIIIDEVNSFRGQAEQSDDITCGVLKFAAASN